MLIKFNREQKKAIREFNWKKGKCICGSKFYEGQSRGMLIQVLGERAASSFRREKFEVVSFCAPCVIFMKNMINGRKVKP